MSTAAGYFGQIDNPQHRLGQRHGHTPRQLVPAFEAYKHRFWYTVSSPKGAVKGGEPDMVHSSRVSERYVYTRWKASLLNGQIIQALEALFDPKYQHPEDAA